MRIKLAVVKEDRREKDGVEYLTVTGTEVGPYAMLQFLDYGLRQDEKIHKGKLMGKTIEIQVEQVRDVFGGRPQLVGSIVSPG